MEGISAGGQVGVAGGAYSYDDLRSLDNLWSSICSAETVVQEPKQVVSTTLGLFQESDFAKKEVDKFDVLVYGEYFRDLHCHSCIHDAIYGSMSRG